MKTFSEYQAAAMDTAAYPDKGSNMVYPALGMAGESGECADKIKKFWRNDGITNASFLNTEQKITLIKEIGDVLWYCAALAHELQTPLEMIAKLNIEKLTDRKARGVVKSEGDNR